MAMPATILHPRCLLLGLTIALATTPALASGQFIAFATWRWMHLQRKAGDAPVYF
jgi:hypothetical protein